MHYEFAGKYTFYPNHNTLVGCLEDKKESVIGVNESRLLLLLLRNPGQIVMRTQIKNFIWEQRGIHVDNSSLTQAVSNLRNILGDSLQTPRYIMTVPKQGYRFISSVETSAPENAVNEHDLQIKNQTTSKRYDALIPKGFKKWHIWSLILPIALFPMVIFQMMQPTKISFTVIDAIDGVVITSPTGRFDQKYWTEPTKKCVSWYLEKHGEEPLPEEIIAISTANNELILSYVYSDNLSYRNLTMHFLTNKDKSYHLCSREPIEATL